MTAGAVVGRDAEIDVVQGFLDGVGGGPAALVLSGEPGIGKTILWRVGVEEARRRFERVLTCRAVEAEAALSFAGLSELFGEPLVEAASSLLAPRRNALEVALLMAEPGDAPPDPLAIALAVHDLLRLLASGGPVLIAVDDAQWLDSTSAGILEVALKRLQNEPVGLLVTARRAGGAPVPLGLERSLPEERLRLLSLGPLTLGALHRLVKERLDLELTRSELARLQEVSGGNPYFVLELARELVRMQARPSPGRRVRVPENLRELLGGRLAQLPAETADVLLEVSALARPTIGLVAAAHGDLERVQDAIANAAREEIIELEDSRVRFAHPLLASICYERAPVWRRRAVHRALAAEVMDIEERARHLALATEGPDAAVASELERASDRAASRGATATAADLSELAAGLTADDPASSRRRRLNAARHHRIAGDQRRAVALLEELLPEVPSGVERADVLLELMTVRAYDRAGRELFDEALAEASGDDVRSVSILSFAAVVGLWDLEVPAGLAAARSALDRAERGGDPYLIAAAIAHLAIVEEYACEITPGLLERGAEIEERLGLELVYHESPRHRLARVLMNLGETERARGILEELRAHARARGDEYSAVMVLWALSMLEWLAGRWEPALECARAAYDLGEQARHPHGRIWVGRVKALIEADLGMVDQARASVEEALAFARAASNQLATVDALASLGRLELALGNTEIAAGHLRDLPERLLAGGVNDPTFPIWADAIETVIATGELNRACAYLEPYERHSKRLGSPLALAGSARCRALLEAAEGNMDAALQTLERSLAESERVPPHELARTLLALGTLRRQALRKKAARDALNDAVAIFQELGAQLWAEKARAELVRIGGRRAGGDELTESESRVAELAAAGRSNKEIAAELFMGVSTVEAHLSRVYRKLGIRSRAGLGARLAGAGVARGKPVDEAPQR